MKNFFLFSLLFLQIALVKTINNDSYKIRVLEQLTHQNQLSLLTEQLIKIFEKTYAIMEEQKIVPYHRYAKKIKFDQEQLLISFEDATHSKKFIDLFQEKSKEEGLLIDCISFQDDQFVQSSDNSEKSWHHTVHTTGIYLDATTQQWLAHDPYLPHQFCLWQLAKKRGAGVTIACIDTGFAVSDAAYLLKNHHVLSDYNAQKNYNLIKDNPFEKFMAFIKTLLKKNKCLDRFDAYKLEALCIESIYQYLEHEKIDRLITYLDTHDCKLNEQMLENLKKQLKQFNLITIHTGSDKPEKFLLELLPIAVVGDLKNSIEATHGSHVAAIARSIAPEASFIMMRAFDHHGKAFTYSIVQSLIATLEHTPLLVNISCKISDFIDPASSYAVTLQALIDLIPYCVASSGNDGHHGIYGQGYPAKFESVAFDIGAFSYDHSKNKYPIPVFSQYELKENYCIGPKFLAPGCNIRSSGFYNLNNCKGTESIVQGTSMAAPIISAFIALMLAEFPDDQDFTREQLLKVCYTSGIFLDDTYDWKNKSLFGALDFRTVLFILHVLRSFKKSSYKTHTIFIDQFDQLVDLIHRILKEVMIDSIKKYPYKDIDPILKDADQAIIFVTNCLLFITNQSTNKPVQLSNSLAKSMKERMKNRKNLFNSHPQIIQKKIKNVLSCDKVYNKNYKMIKNYLGAYDFSKFLHNVQWYEKYWNQQISKKEKVHL